MVRIVCRRNVSGKTLITGFQGLGYVGSISVDHLINVLGAERIGFIETSYMPPVVWVKREKIQLPYEIYEFKDLVILRFEGVPMNRMASLLMHEVVKWASENRVEKMILIGGLNISYREGEGDHVRFIANNIYEERYGKVKPIVQEGVQIVGPLALLLNYSEIYNVPAVALLAYADPDRIDPRGAANALKALSKIINIEVDISELIDKARRVEEEIRVYSEVVNKEEGRRISGMYA